MSKKKFDPDRYLDEWDQDTSMTRGVGYEDSFEEKPKAKRACPKCGSKTYTRLRYDNKAVGFRKWDAIGCTKCFKG